MIRQVFAIVVSMLALCLSGCVSNGGMALNKEAKTEAMAHRLLDAIVSGQESAFFECLSVRTQTDAKDLQQGYEYVCEQAVTAYSDVISHGTYYEVRHGPNELSLPMPLSMLGRIVATIAYISNM
jgi:Flp pilus assembly protein TadD